MVKFTCTETHLHVDLSSSSLDDANNNGENRDSNNDDNSCHRVNILSSAVWNGGFISSSNRQMHILNMKVPASYTGEEDAISILRDYAKEHGINSCSDKQQRSQQDLPEMNGGEKSGQQQQHQQQSKTSCDGNGDSDGDEDVESKKITTSASAPITVVGLMTAASMKSMRYKHRIVAVEEQSQTFHFHVWVTAGTGNARRVGDRADYRQIILSNAKHDNEKSVITAGTINIIVYTNVPLSQTAMVEALMVVTEAKTTACLQFQIPSPISGLAASGTGTDSIALACSIAPSSSTKSSEMVHFCGKHTLIGEILGQLVLEATTESIQAGLDYVASLSSDKNDTKS